MKINRRTLLGSIGWSGAAVSTLSTFAYAAPQASSVSIVLTDIDPATSAEKLFTLLDPILSYSIPVSLIIKTTDQKGNRLTKDSDLSVFLRRFLSDYPGLGEFIPWSPEIVGKKSYFQMRSASTAFSQLIRTLGLNKKDADPKNLPVTLASNLDTSDVLRGVRVSGARAALFLPEKSTPVTMQIHAGGVLAISGGVVQEFGASLQELAIQMDQTADPSGLSVIHLGLGKLNSFSDDAVFEHASKFAETIAKLVLTGKVSPALARENLDRFFADFSRLGAIYLRPPEDADIERKAACDAFSALLDEANIAFSVTEPADIATGTPIECFAPGGATALEEATETTTTDRVCLTPAVLDADLRTQLNNSGIDVVLAGDQLQISGLDEHAITYLGDHITLDGQSNPAEQLDKQSRHRDLIIAIDTDAVITHAGRSSLLNALVRMRDGGGTEFADLSDFTQTVFTPDPIFQVLRKTRFMAGQTKPLADDLNTKERTSLLVDAWLAWSYIEKMTDPATGLCPSTVSFGEGDPFAYHVVTMWDVGSLIFAAISAHEIGIIQAPEFQARTSDILDSLPNREITGLRLPSGEIATNRKDSGTSEFNACDTGRLLSALFALKRYDFARDRVNAIVSGWDLDQVIEAGHIYSIENGRRTNASFTHCSHYTARAFGLWGLDVKSPYQIEETTSQSDNEMDLLYRAAAIGAYGAEPLLLEQIEMDRSWPSQVLAEALFAMQLEAYQTDGALVCVSETPLNREPWFTYQGLNLSSATDRWTVSTIENLAKYRTRGFKRAATMVSTKAAFLWSALYPHDYTDKLLEHLRAVARLPEKGYASGVFSATGLPTAGYTDINTNAVIMQAVSQRLGTSKSQN